MLPGSGLPIDCVYNIAHYSAGFTVKGPLQATCDAVFDVIEKRLRVMSYQVVTNIDAYSHWRLEEFQVAANSEEFRHHMLNRMIRAQLNAYDIRDLQVKFGRVCPQCTERDLVVGFDKAGREHKPLPFNDDIVGIILTGAEACDFLREVQ